MKRASYCNRFGHDWAYQDCETFMTKICLRCGQEIFFFPDEVENAPKLDDDDPDQE